MTADMLLLVALYGSLPLLGECTGGIAYSARVPVSPGDEYVNVEYALDTAHLENMRFTKDFLSPTKKSLGRLKRFYLQECDQVKNRCTFYAEYERGKPAEVYMQTNKIDPVSFNEMIRRQGLEVGDPECDTTTWCVPERLTNRTQSSRRTKREENKGVNCFGGYFAQHARVACGDIVSPEQFASKKADLQKFRERQYGALNQSLLDLVEFTGDTIRSAQSNLTSVFEGMGKKLNNFEAQLVNKTKELSRKATILSTLTAEIVANQVYNAAENYWEVVNKQYETYNFRVQLLSHAFRCTKGFCAEMMKHLAQHDPELGVLLSLDFKLNPSVIIGQKQIYITYIKPNAFTFQTVLTHFKPAVFLQSGCRRVLDKYWCPQCFRQDYQRDLAQGDKAYLEVANPVPTTEDPTVESGSCWTEDVSPSVIFSTPRGCLNVSLLEDGTFSMVAVNTTCEGRGVNTVVPDVLLTHPLVGTIDLDGYEVQQKNYSKLLEPLKPTEFDRENFEKSAKTVDDAIDKTFKEIDQNIEENLNYVAKVSNRDSMQELELNVALGLSAAALLIVLARFAYLLVFSKTVRKFGRRCKRGLAILKGKVSGARE